MPFWRGGSSDRQRRDPPNPRLTRLRKLRHLSDLEVGKLDFDEPSCPKRRPNTARLAARAELALTQHGPVPLPLPREDGDDVARSRASVGSRGDDVARSRASVGSRGDDVAGFRASVGSRGDDVAGSRASVGSRGDDVARSRASVGSRDGPSCCYSSPSSPCAVRPQNQNPSSPKTPKSPRTPTNRESLLSPFSHRNNFHYKTSPEINNSNKSRSNNNSKPHKKYPYKSEPSSACSSPTNSPRFCTGITNSATAMPTGGGLNVWSAPEIQTSEIGGNLGNFGGNLGGNLGGFRGKNLNLNLNLGNLGGENWGNFGGTGPNLGNFGGGGGNLGNSGGGNLNLGNYGGGNGNNLGNFGSGNVSNYGGGNLSNFGGGNVNNLGFVGGGNANNLNNLGNFGGGNANLNNLGNFGGGNVNLNNLGNYGGGNVSLGNFGGTNVNVHPLPLPPGAELEPVKEQWKKGSLIGSGTFGNVYEGTNRHTGALCAMKEVTIVPGDSKSLECLKQLEQEIEFLKQFKHENIVQYYGSEIIGDRFYIYLEYVHPGSISKYVKQHCGGAVTESVVRNFTRHILNGLAYLHSMKIMHRDIKGANLLVDAKGVVKLADFGMAKHLSTLAPNLSLKGTPYWMAPEVVQATMHSESGYDLAIDIWSLGCTIIEMLTGKHPWVGLEGAAAMFKVLHTDPAIPPALSSEGRDFLKRCFRRNPAERATAAALLEHAFIRNSKHYSVHGSLQAFAAITIHDAGQKKKEKSKPSKSDPAVRNKNNSSPARANHTHSHSHSASSPSGPLSGLPRSSPELYPALPIFPPRSPTPRPGPHSNRRDPL